MNFRKRPLGFSLIEAAIVLAIIGLVMGGIWIAAARTKSNLMLQQATAGYLQIYNQLREKYPPSLTSALGVDYALTASDVTGLSMPAGFNLYGGFQIQDPFGDTVALTVNATQWGSQSGVYSISIANRPDSTGTVSLDPLKCNYIISRLTSTSGPRELVQVVFSDVPSAANRTIVPRSAFPIPPTSANCQRARIFMAFSP